KIAQYPLANRDESKLLIWRGGQIKEDQFKNISGYLEPNTSLVFNTTRVVNARIRFLNSRQQNIELFCLGPDESDQDPSKQMLKKATVRWRCFVGNLKRWKAETLKLGKAGVMLKAEIAGRQNDYVI